MPAAPEPTTTTSDVSSLIALSHKRGFSTGSHKAIFYSRVDYAKSPYANAVRSIEPSLTV